MPINGAPLLVLFAVKPGKEGVLPYWKVCVHSLHPSLPAGVMLRWTDCLNSTPCRSRTIRHGMTGCAVLLCHLTHHFHSTPLLPHVTEHMQRNLWCEQRCAFKQAQGPAAQKVLVPAGTPVR